MSNKGKAMKALDFYALRLIVLSFLVLLSGCPDSKGTATIRYEQLGACNGYKEGNSTVSAGPNAAFVIFKINNIDNRNGKVNFSYDPTKLYLTSSSPRTYVSSNLSLTQKIGVLGTISANVPAGTDLPQNGYAVITVPTANSPDPQIEANKSNYTIDYETGAGDPGILLEKKNLSQTQYQGAQDCLSKAW